MSRQRAAIPEGHVVVDKEVYDNLQNLYSEVHHTGAVLRTIDYGAVFGGMTCTEAEALAGVFAAAGDQATHDHIITSHGHGDDDPEDEHHNIYEEAHRGTQD